ncbi:MAG: beta-class carbonic anhydrase [Bacillaceae bacterium]
MTLINDILTYNETFVKNGDYKKYEASKYPGKRMVILSCMDTRLVELLPKAMNIANGDVKIVKIAGALVSHPFGAVMRSLLVAVYELNADEVCVIGHHDCGMANIKAENVIEHMLSRGVTERDIKTLTYGGVDLNKWLHGFDRVEDSVMHSTDIIRNHPLFPKDVPVHGLVIDPATGKLDFIDDGYKKIASKEEQKVVE